MMLVPATLARLASEQLGWWAPLVGGVLAFAEAILGVGLVLPGEAAISTLAATTSRDQLPLLLLCATLGAVAGDHLNYALGRRFRERLPESRLVRRIGTHHWERGAQLLRSHGGSSLIVSRLIPVVRTLMPAVAGVVELPYRTFLWASLVGSTLWSLLWILAGSVVAELLRTHAIPTLTTVALTVLALTGGHAVRGHRRARRIGGRSPNPPTLNPRPNTDPPTVSATEVSFSADKSPAGAMP